MLHTALLAIVLAQNATCSGTDLSVASARVVNVSRNNGLNHYTIAVSVKNMGAGQPGNALQFVDVYKNGEKKDARGVPPLGSGQAYTFDYGYDRSSMAGTARSLWTSRSIRVRAATATRTAASA